MRDGDRDSELTAKSYVLQDYEGASRRAKCEWARRWQAEVINLKKQKLKVSKSDKLAWKKEKKGLTKNLRAVQAEAAALRSAPLASAADATPLCSSQHALPGFKGFDLPMPVHANAASGTSWFHNS
jgi:hypothetical protein